MENLTSNPHENHGPLMAGVMWGLFTLASVFMGVRLYARVTYAKLWHDDCVMILGWLAFLGLAIMNQLAIDLGFGKHALDVYGASALSSSVVAIAASKISFAVTLIPLTSGWTRYYVFFAITSTAIFATPTAITPWVQCRPLVKTFADFWPGDCIDKQPSVVYCEFAVWSAIIDFSLALLPWKLLWTLKMRTTEKIGVMVAMSLGLLSGVTSIIRTTYISQLSLQDMSYDALDNNIWTGIEIAAAIIAASIPVLRKFLREKMASTVHFLRTGRKGNSKVSSQQTTGGSKNSASKTIRLSSNISKGRSTDIRPRSYLELDDKFNEEGVYYV